MSESATPPEGTADHLDAGGTHTQPPELRAANLPAPVRQLLEGLEGTIKDPATKQQLEVTIAGAIARSAFTSPYPPPEILRAYGEVIPGLDKTLVAKVDAQTTHRQELERHVIMGNARRADRGQVIAGTIGILGLIFALAIALLADPWAGVAFGGIDLAGLAGVFVYGSQQQRQPRAAEPTQAPGVADSRPPTGGSSAPS